MGQSRGGQAGYCLRTLGGGGVVWDPGQPWPTHPPTHIRKFFLGQKKTIIKGGQEFEANFRYTNLLLASP